MLNRQVVTIAGVRMSPDLKLATVAFLPLGGADAAQTLGAPCRRTRRRCGRCVAQRVNLKYAPDLRFVVDESFDVQARMDALLRSPRVARDLEPPPDEETQVNEHARRRRRDAASAAAPHPARRGQRLDQSRQARRRHLDPGGRPAQTPVQRQEGGPRRHARSARLRRAAGRVRRGDQDRAGRAGRA